jgi:hypothetical protein
MSAVAALAAVLVAAAPRAAVRHGHAVEPGPRARAVAAASRAVGRTFGGDCSGFVLRVYGAAGIHLRLAPARSRSESLYRATRHTRRPRPGDLAFFHDTYDRDRDGRADDPFTHVGVVDSVAGRRITVVHVLGHTVVRTRMDLARPSDPRRNGPVRARRADDARGTRTLAGELLAGFGAMPVR